MRQVFFNKKPYDKEIKKFQVSRDLVMAALVIETNQILIFNVLDQHSGEFFSQQDFHKDKVLKHGDSSKEILDLFFIRNEGAATFGHGQYSLYVAYQNLSLIHI